MLDPKKKFLKKAVKKAASMPKDESKAHEKAESPSVEKAEPAGEGKSEGLKKFSFLGKKK